MRSATTAIVSTLLLLALSASTALSQPEAFAFVVISDSRTKDHLTGVEQDMAQIQEWINNPAPDMPAPSFMVCLGDFDHTTQTEAIIDSVLGIDFLWYPVIGNHEIDDINDFVYCRDTIFPTLPGIVATGPTGSVGTSYSWEWNNAHFVAVNCYWDGNPAAGHDYVTSGDVPVELRNWTDADLGATSQPHKFAFVHEPAYPEVRHVTDSLDQYPANRDSFVTMLDDNDTQALFVAHDHYYHHDVAAEHPLLGDMHQVDAGQFQGPGAGGDGNTIVYVLVDDDTATYKVYRSNTGVPFALSEEWTIITSGGPATYTLTVNVVGSGSVTLDPPGGVYDEGTVVKLTAMGDPDWTFSGWSGDLGGSGNPDSLTIMGNSTATAHFSGATTTAICEDFESGYTLGAELRTHADWFYESGSSGPIPTAGIGVAGTIGLSNGDRGFAWEAHEFDWNDPTLTGVWFQMDYQTDNLGRFDDDRLGWSISKTDDSSDWHFAVQMDPGGGGAGGNIECYWDGNTFGDDGGRHSIADLPALTGETWYRFRGEFTKLTATSCRIDVKLTELDAVGDTVGVVVTGTLADTDLLANTSGEEIPNPGYFTASGMWPLFKNFQNLAGAADNACYGVVTTTPQYTLTVNEIGGGIVTLDPPGGVYDEGTVVELTANADPDWMFSGWFGDLTGSANPDSVTMTGNLTVTATFVEATNLVFMEPFERGFTLGADVGNHPDWFDGGDDNGCDVTAGIGLGDSIGLAPGQWIFTWTAHPFNWNTSDFNGVILEMDFQTDINGEFDDDRMGLMTKDDDNGSDYILGVQLDHADGGLVTYWRNESDTRVQDQIVDISGVSANTWYRFRATFTRLDSTSAEIDVTLTELDVGGNPTGTPFTGTVENTSLWSGGAPAVRYFTAPAMWAAFKNFWDLGGAADNAYFEILYEGVSGVSPNGVPPHFLANYPNPFSRSTTIKFGVPVSGHVKLTIFDALGRRVSTLVDKELPAGVHDIVWNGRDERGRSVSTGTYFFLVDTGKSVRMGRMVLIR